MCLCGMAFWWGLGGGPRGLLAPGVGCRALSSSCPEVSCATGDGAAPHQVRGALRESPPSPFPSRAEKRALGASRSDLHECPQPSARSYEVPVSQDGRMAFPLCSPGMCCNGAAASILCPPPRRGGVSASARVTRHTLPPPSHQIGLRWPQQPSPVCPSCGHHPHRQRSRAPKVPPCCRDTGCPRAGGSRQVWGHATKAMPLPALTQGVPRLLRCWTPASFSQLINKRGADPIEAQLWIPRCWWQPQLPWDDATIPAPLSCPQRALLWVEHSQPGPALCYPAEPDALNIIKKHGIVTKKNENPTKRRSSSWKGASWAGRNPSWAGTSILHPSHAAGACWSGRGGDGSRCPGADHSREGNGSQQTCELLCPGSSQTNRIFAQALGTLGRALVPRSLLKGGTCHLGTTQRGGCLILSPPHSRASGCDHRWDAGATHHTGRESSPSHQHPISERGTRGSGMGTRTRPQPRASLQLGAVL